MIHSQLMFYFQWNSIVISEWYRFYWHEDVNLKQKTLAIDSGHYAFAVVIQKK